ncbi:MAG: pyridoxal phosphate-dependent aminotransferase [Pseudomonadota bacterium]
MTGPRYSKLIQSLPSSVPFVAPEQQERARGEEFSARLGANESLFGASPMALEAMQEQASAQWKYGDPTSHDLRNALAAHHNIKPENIVVGEGIDGLLGYLVRLLIEPGDAVVTSDGAYPTFNYHVEGFGGVLHKVSYRDDHEDPDALIAKARETNAKLIYLANPDNPMGTWHKGTRIEHALRDLPEGCLLILDEAYIDFAPADTAPTISANDPRLIRMRTFSKAYGLAGARVGYAIGTRALIKNFDKIRNHFGMNRAAQFGALASLQDQAWLGETYTAVKKARVRIAKIATQNGLTSLPSATNFVAIDCGADGAFADAVLHALTHLSVFVRKPSVPPQDRYIRVTCGPASDLDVLEAALPKALKIAKEQQKLNDS